MTGFFVTFLKNATFKIPDCQVLVYLRAQRLELLNI